MAERAEAVSADQWAYRERNAGPASNGEVPDLGDGPRAWASRFWCSFSSIGLAGGIIGFCISLLPSLIPRHWLVQAAFSGLTVVLGYAGAVLLGWVARRSGVRPDWSERTRRRGRIALAVGGVVAVVTLTVLSARWQSDLRRLFEMPGVEPAFAAVPLVAAVVATGLIMLGRAVRSFACLVRRTLGRWLPDVVVRMSGAALLAVFLVLIFNGVFMTWLVQGMDRVAVAIEADDPGVAQPVWPERSGSTDSLIPWGSLGAGGRAFVSGGPSPDTLADFATRRGKGSADPDAQVPIRVY
ncbi:alpha/beta-hydrolase N-terminal domain-containing protein, partial [Phytoactinopolyspora endophytica]|uniref:alpha/beta-hydrolase N-terminal domain-containing protein n=1 Tax=Phytoactinopolyspora endophytica TaxID=1642495 RepID=UPI0023EA6495